MHILKVYWYLITIRLKGQASYHGSYCIEVLGYFLQMATHIGGICFIFAHVTALDGWSIWEILYLYGVTSFAFVLAQLTAECFEDLHLHIKSGEFDQMLTKPISPIIQIAALSFRIERFGGLLQSVAAIVIAITYTKALASFFGFLYILIAILSMFIIYYALFLAAGAFAFWSLESSEIFNAFTYGGIEVAKYPLSIYQTWMQVLFVYCIPLGVANYLPGAALFNKSAALSIWAPSVLFVPLIALAFLGLVWVCWIFSLKHYQSTGS